VFKGIFKKNGQNDYLLVFGPDRDSKQTKYVGYVEFVKILFRPTKKYQIDIKRDFVSKNIIYYYVISKKTPKILLV
jgi:hypothetical protein